MRRMESMSGNGPVAGAAAPVAVDVPLHYDNESVRRITEVVNDWMTFAASTGKNCVESALEEATDRFLAR